VATRVRTPAVTRRPPVVTRARVAATNRPTHHLPPRTSPATLIAREEAPAEGQVEVPATVVGLVAIVATVVGLVATVAIVEVLVAIVATVVGLVATVAIVEVLVAIVATVVGLVATVAIVEDPAEDQATIVATVEGRVAIVAIVEGLVAIVEGQAAIKATVVDQVATAEVQVEDLATHTLHQLTLQHTLTIMEAALSHTTAATLIKPQHTITIQAVRAPISNPTTNHQTKFLARPLIPIMTRARTRPAVAKPTLLGSLVVATKGIGQRLKRLTITISTTILTLV
jgi:hypothetical protein